MAQENEVRGIEEFIYRKKDHPGIVQGLHLKYPHLVHLNLSQNRIPELPNHFFDLIHLRHLNLSFNELICLPDDFEKLKELTYLDVCGNQLTGKGISKGFFKLVALRHLHLSDNNLESIPEEISQMKNLRVIGLRNTGLKNLNYGVFEAMGRLREINLQGNYLVRL